jgi:hypothetical protein
VSEQAESTRTCEVCGATTGEDASFCPGCGRRLDIPPPRRRDRVDLNALEEDTTPVGPRRMSGKALVALVLAVFGIAFLPPLSLFASLVAVIVGLLARRDIAADPLARGGRLAMVAVVLGAIGLVLGVLIALDVIGVDQNA